MSKFRGLPNMSLCEHFKWMEKMAQEIKEQRINGQRGVR